MRSGRLGWFVGLAALAAGIGGASCTPSPITVYQVTMDPNDGVMERRLTVWSQSPYSDDANASQAAPEVLDAMAAKYPRRIAADANAAKQSFAGTYAGKLPGEFGGAGQSRFINTQMGSAGGYIERFSGTDDLTYQVEQITLAADILSDVLHGWLASQLNGKPGFNKLSRFMKTDFPRDLKNVTLYLWSARCGLSANAEQKAEVRARVVLYLIEHDYVRYDHLFAFIRTMSDEATSSGQKAQAGAKAVRSFLARRMEVEETDSSLDFLNDPDDAISSLNEFVKTSEDARRGAELWRGKSASWPDHQDTPPATETQPAPENAPPATAPAEPDYSETLGNVAGSLAEKWGIVELMIPLAFMNASDKVMVTLSLPAQPLTTNGNWDANARAVNWGFDYKGTPLSTIGWAAWAAPNEGFQTKHFGRVVLDGNELATYCGWHKGLSAAESGRWDEFLKTIEPENAEDQLSRFIERHKIERSSAETMPASGEAETAPATQRYYVDPHLSGGAAMILEAIRKLSNP